MVVLVFDRFWRAKRKKNKWIHWQQNQANHKKILKMLKTMMTNKRMNESFCNSNNKKIDFFMKKVKDEEMAAQNRPFHDFTVFDQRIRITQRPSPTNDFDQSDFVIPDLLPYLGEISTVVWPASALLVKCIIEFIEFITFVKKIPFFLLHIF